MAIVNSLGANISFECNELINELRNDLFEFGNRDYAAIYKMTHGVRIIVDYVFTEDMADVKLDRDENIAVIDGQELLDYLKKQNSII